MSAKPIPFTQAQLKELIHYCPETGWVAWRERGVETFKSEAACRSWNSRYSGIRAGQIWTNPKCGYQCRRISIRKRTYREHRLIWLYMTGCQPPPMIDHANNDATDNRWENLRDGTDINHLSKSMSSINKSGVCGVFWSESWGKWVAQVGHQKQTIYLGSFHPDDLDLAAMEVMETRIELGFDLRHGLMPAHYHQVTS